MKQNQIFQIFGTDYKAMTVEILERSGLKDRIPSKSARIGIKPNLVVPSPAVTGATTHPEIVAGIIEYLRKYGYTHILLTEGVWIGEKTEECLEYTGFGALCREMDVPFVDVRSLGNHIVNCAGMDLRVSDVVDEIDFLIGVPVLKGHCQVKMTCALKNMKGLVPDAEKRRFHALGVHDPVGRLCAGIRQDFIVIDHICGDPTSEDGGDPVTCNCIMTALDPVLADAYGRDLLHLSPEQVPYLSIAAECGIGCDDLQTAEIISLNGSGFSASLPESAGKLDVAFAVHEVQACSACYANLLPALRRLREEGLLSELDTKIAIGQAHRGKTGRLGVGDCTRGFDTCVSGCPPTERQIFEGIREYILRSDSRPDENES